MKLIDLTKFINEFDKRYNDITKKYINKLDKLNKDREDTISSAGKQSEKFIKDKVDQIEIEIAKVEEAMNKKLRDLDEQINSWIYKQKKAIEENIINSAKARLGIDTTKIDK